MKKGTLELLAPETIKLFGSTKSEITKDINGEITEVVLVHCDVCNIDYQRDPGVLYTFVPNKSFGQLLDILPNIFIFYKKI